MKRGTIVCAAALVALTVGIFALRFPVFIDALDQFGWQVKCGDGFTTDLAQASSADSAKNGDGPNAVARGTDYVGQCATALMVRRVWAIPVAAVGGIALTGLAIAVLAQERCEQRRLKAPRAERL